MADRPIIFSAPMVRALLDGRKTQTRRILKPQPAAGAELEHKYCDGVRFSNGQQTRIRIEKGDRLYVREAHALVPTTAYRMSEGIEQAINPDLDWQAAIYRAGWDRSTGGLRWRPSIHMPRWASRLTLTVTDVRVQPLRAISEKDARAEGIAMVIEDSPSTAWFSGLHLVTDLTGPMDGWHCNDAPCAFADLWETINGPEAWAANPWVVAYSFTVERRNIDQKWGVL
jgi:hypothetical protein